MDHLQFLREAGRKGGEARERKLTKAQRIEIARNAGRAPKRKLKIA